MIAELAHYPTGFSIQSDVAAVDTGDLEIDIHNPMTVPGRSPLASWRPSRPEPSRS